MAPNGFAERFRILRKTSGYSQQNVADALGIDRTTYSCYERGVTVPSAEICFSLARLYNLSVAELIEGDQKSLLDRDRAMEEPREQDALFDRITALSKEERELICFFRSLPEDRRESMKEALRRLLPDS